MAVPYVAEGVAFLVLLALSAFFSAAEVALIGFSRLRRRQLVEEEHPKIRHVERLLAHPQRFLITILIGNTVADAAAVVLVAWVALDAAPLLSMSPWIALVLASTLAILLLLTLGEVIPKAYAAVKSETFALVAAPPLYVLSLALHPVVRFYEALTMGVVRKSGVEPSRAAQALRNEEELKTLITLGTEEGIIEEEEEEMIHSVIEFADTTAKEVIVPRIDVAAVPADATLDAIKAFVLESGYSRLPVYQGNLDHVVGILHVKEMLIRLTEGKGGTHVREIMHEPFFVPETKKLDDLLSEMRERRAHMAIVIDEFGGTAGVLTLEDMIEEIVGDIFDEYDLRTEPIRRIDDRTAVVDARSHVADVNDALDIDIPEDGPYDTVGGFAFSRLGRLGKEGEVLHHGTFDMAIEKVSNRRILRVRIVKREDRSEDAETAEAAQEP